MSEMFLFLNSAIKFDEKRENNTVVSLLAFLASGFVLLEIYQLINLKKDKMEVSLNLEKKQQQQNNGNVN